MADKKYYWLRLQKDFFKRHDIRIIEAMSNGKDYILFYLKLLVESVSHEGELRFSETIPYNDEMLATITNTNIDIVRSAMKVFTELKMIEILDDQTIFMAEVDKMIGTSSQDEHTRESTRNRVRKYRENQKALDDNALQKRYSNVTCNGELEIEIEKEKEKEIEKDINRAKSTRFVPPTLDEVKDYCFEMGYTMDAEHFIDFYESKGWMVGKNKMKDWKAAIRNWMKNQFNSGGNSKDSGYKWETY